MECAKTDGNTAGIVVEKCGMLEAKPYSDSDCRFAELNSHYRILKDGEIVGYVGWVGAKDPEAYRVVALTLVIKKEYRGRGYYKKAMLAVLDFLHSFSKRIWILTEIRNAKLVKICKGIGFYGCGIYQYFLYHNLKKNRALEFAKGLIPLIDKRELA